MSYKQIAYYEVHCDDCDLVFQPGAKWSTKETADHYVQKHHTWTLSNGRHLCGLEICAERKRRRNGAEGGTR